MKLYILISALVCLTFASESLGPIRSCRCMDAHESALSYSHQTNPGGFGPPILCHCLPTSTSFHTPTFSSRSFLDKIQPLSVFKSSTVRSPGESCQKGTAISGKYTVDDKAELKMCDKHLSWGSLNQLINVDLSDSSYPCGDFKFELKNEKYSSGLAFSIDVNGYKFAAIGVDTPTLPPGVIPLRTYAKWTYGSCENNWPGTNDKAVYVSTLDGTNQAFEFMKKLGSYPVGVQNGNVYDGGLQCVVIENPFCYDSTKSA